MERSEQVGDLITALAKAQAEFTFAAKDSSNPAFNSKYADLAANIIAVRPALAKHGIALMQFDASDVERQTASVTTALHFAEQWISVTVEAPAVGMKGFNVQSLGACWTYLRRYTLQALCGLASDDDDGNSLAVENKPVASKKLKEDLKASLADTSVVRSQFFAKAKELGWGLGEIKKYLIAVFQDGSTSKLSEKQLADTLEAFALVKPEEYFAQQSEAEPVAAE
jgi:ERF superfamily